MNVAVRFFVLIFFVSPFLAWFIVKPIRVVAPNTDLLHCDPSFICTEGKTNHSMANDLYAQSIKSLALKLGEPDSQPKVIFCSTRLCDEYFGLGKRSAITFGTFGTVVSSRSWKQYYVEHELVHYLQYENLGYVKVLLMPSWLKEGMAYSISSDPRQKLKSPWQEYRIEFESIFGDSEDIWHSISEY